MSIRLSKRDAAGSIVLFARTRCSGYVWRVSRVPEVEDQDEENEPGSVAAIAQLPARRQRALMGVLMAMAATVIFPFAEPFAEAIVHCGDRRLLRFMGVA